MTQLSTRPNGLKSATRYGPALLVLLTGLYSCRVFRVGLAGFHFDDALMFVRYANNLRQGYGIAWNPGGGHVFGPTSLSWLGIAWLGSFLPAAPVTMMVAASWLFGVAALCMLSFSLRLSVRERQHVSPAILGVAISLPLLLNEHFQVSMTSGMETMLALLLMACFVIGCQRLLHVANPQDAVCLAALGYLLVLTRPEAVISVCALPLAFWGLQNGRKNWRAVVTFVATLTVLLAVTLMLTRLYFGGALPLAVYCKSLRGYAGYRLLLNPLAYLVYFLEMVCVPCVVLALYVQRKHVRMLAPFLVALFLQVAYLTSVNQIMGWGGRYYVPYLPLIIVPATITLNDGLRDAHGRNDVFTAWRVATLACLVCIANSQIMASLYAPMGRFLIRHRRIYAEPRFVTAAHAPLPGVEWWDSCNAISEIVNKLPPGAAISSSEVGLLGWMNPHLRIIDSSGLNDAVIARRFSPEYILGEKPDLIWMIHPDYTKDYGELSSAPGLLKGYTLYAHAFNFGVAIRNDSPSYVQLTAALREAWGKTYPGFNMDDYRTTEVIWNDEPVIDRKRTIVVQP